MVGAAGEDGGGAVELFGQHHAHQHVRPDHRSEGQREIRFGAWELRTYREVEAEDPGLARAYWETPGHACPPEGESWNQTRARVDTAIDRLVADHAGTDLVIVAHFGVILTQIQRALGLDGASAFGHRIDNLSVTEITHRTGGWQVGQINHLP